MAKPAEDARDAILEAASRLLAEEGPAALTVRRIAAEAGGSTMNVYSRFGGKDGVVDALHREGFARLKGYIQAGRKTKDPVADLRRCAAAYRRFGLEHPTYYLVMFARAVPDYEPSDEAHDEAVATLRSLADVVERAMDAGAIAVGDGPLSVAGDLWAVNHGLVSLELQEMGPPGMDWGRRHTETIAAVLRGLAPST